LPRDDLLESLAREPETSVHRVELHADAKSTVIVRNQDPQPNGMPLPPEEREVTLEAWRKTGTTFVAAGLGATYALSRVTSGIAELKVHQMFGTPGTAASLQLGCAFGF
jgi:hypothetical protein